jgi:ABC-type sugar transport system ATPase subunit
MLDRAQGLFQWREAVAVHLAEQQSKLAVQLVYVTHCLNAWVILADTLTVGKSGIAGITSAGIEFAQAVAHEVLSPLKAGA